MAAFATATVMLCGIGVYAAPARESEAAPSGAFAMAESTKRPENATSDDGTAVFADLDLPAEDVLAMTLARVPGTDYEMYTGLLYQQDEVNSTYHYTLNDNGRLQEIAVADSKEEPTDLIDLTYNDDGHLSSAVQRWYGWEDVTDNISETYDFVYDGDVLTEIDLAWYAYMGEGGDENGYGVFSTDTGYLSYDEEGRIASITWTFRFPEASAVFSYDDSGRLAAVNYKYGATLFTYDEDGALIRTEDKYECREYQ